MKNIILKSILSLGLLAGITACRKSDSPLTKVTPSNLDSIASNYYEQYLKLYPLDATSQGDTRYNDQLPINIDKDFISGEVAFYSSVQKQLENVDYEKLSDESKTVYDVLDYTLQDKIEAYAYHPEYIPFTQFSGLPLTFPLYGSGQGPQPFKTTQDYDNWLKRMEKFPEWMNAATENFREGINSKMVLPKKLVIKMIPQMRAPEIISIDLKTNIFYGPINNFPKGFTKAQKDQYTTLYKESVTKNIIPAYTRMGDFLEKEYLPKARDTDGYNSLPNGNDIYRYYVKSWTTTKYTPEEINKTGLQQVAMLRAEMEKVKQQVGFKGTLEEFISYVKTDPKAMPYKTSKEVLDAFNAILTKITPKLKTMFSVTPKTKFEIRQTEKFREASASAEYIQGTADGKRPGIFYVPLPDPSKFNVTSGMESLFLHEAIPGHHYQVSLQQENTKLPKFMRFGWFGAYGEGWAHYCETLGPEFGLYTDPYQKMGYLSDQMLRAVRLVVDTGLHTGKMTREDAIKYFLNNIAYDEAGATAEVERYMAMPGQALGYKIGSLRIRELREQYQKELGKKFSLAKFHDEILNQGCLPLDVLNRKMELWAKKQK
ncbi:MULTISPECIES: DUF885 domain-containing protein [Chryseobacterium]|uniref:Uncharacterized protein (DUF885 family) n=1 Tax=Chryseobacterium camelliae TaxID=1265445 RepID=A0ABU0TM84_9FLAO|nr:MULTISPECIES: DUF885 domain-containing protein [Chryseobacterium]MDQ1098154.1 uncharacterized protein (DUF885 family) [Chryseobacterium camelliae]MDQ1102084.1 uncharacterized protein (DUF885 family) [Chryseobacterium sp. SORGH_AS_1048]MDR6129884.1 uncharacterized protein (DUF885 family) [Chryseobacterium sp. SORGH_AS_1175]MDT3407989.1 uncharacterized protein (DUF885 family) [Pseudacidovorax intermedius]